MFVLAASCCVGQCSTLSLCLYLYFCIYLYMLLPFARISMYVLVAYCRGGQGSALSLCHMSAGYIRPQPTRRASVLPNSAAENTLGGKGRQRVAKKVWEWSLRQVWTFVGPSSICPHSFSGSAFCSWFWHCLSCFGLPQPAHMITSVDHLKTMGPGWINVTCFTFVRRCPLLTLSGLNWFSVKIVLELMPWKRGTCVTPTLKSPASWSRWDLFKNFVLTLTIRCGRKCFVIQLIFFYFVSISVSSPRLTFVNLDLRRSDLEDCYYSVNIITSCHSWVRQPKA